VRRLVRTRLEPGGPKDGRLVFGMPRSLAGAGAEHDVESFVDRGLLFFGRHGRDSVVGGVVRTGVAFFGVSFRPFFVGAFDHFDSVFAEDFDAVFAEFFGGTKRGGDGRSISKKNASPSTCSTNTTTSVFPDLREEG